MGPSDLKHTGNLPDAHAEKTKNSLGRGFVLRLVIIFAVLAAFVACFIFLWFTFRFLLVVFMGILLAIFLRGLAGWLRSITGISHGLALAAVILIILGGIALGGIFLIPDVSNQLGNLQSELTTSWHQVGKNFSDLPLIGNFFKHLNPQSLLERGASLKSVQSFFSFTFLTITEFIIVIFVGLYLAFDPGLYVGGVVALVPIRFRARFRQVIETVGYALGWWLIGIFFDMGLVGVITVIGLMILGVPLALILGIISGLLTFIPTFGLLISLIPAVIVAMTGGIMKAVSVIVLYLIAHAVEAYVAGPLIQKKMVSLPPVLTIAGLFIFGELFGILGLIVATPLIVASLVIIKLLYVENVLGDKVGPIKMG